MSAKLSILISARKDSKYLAKFLFGLFQNTDDFSSVEVLVMLNEGDTWNAELVNYFRADDHKDQNYYVKFFRENYGLGRHGLHIYFNDLLKYATGEWIIYFCEDHFIHRGGWDTYLRRFIAGAAGEANRSDRKFPLDPSEPWVIVPKFDNAGAMNHIVSRGFVEALGGVLGNHGWIDSYINDLTFRAWGDHPKRVLRMDLELFHDFTHDHPNPMDVGRQQSKPGDDGSKLPKHESPEYWAAVESDKTKLIAKS